LEDLKEIDRLNLTTIFNKQISHKPSHCFVGSNKNKSKARPQSLTEPKSLIFEVEEHKDTEKVLE